MILAPPKAEDAVEQKALECGDVILGIDPGTGRTGFGAVRHLGKNSCEFIRCGCITTSADLTREQRLRSLFEQLSLVFDETKPAVAVVEELFFCRNVTTAMAVGEARGVILLTAAMRDVPVASYTATAVKEAVSGSGRASKKEVCMAVMHYLDLQKKPTPDDASDGLAIALCHKFWEDINN